MGVELVVPWTSMSQPRGRALKRQLKAKTAVVEALRHRLGTTSSGYLDIGIAALGKDSSESANLRRMRSDIERVVKAAKTAVEPAPLA
jgi:Holliday junction resolvase RusA-like endonuclease